MKEIKTKTEMLRRNGPDDIELKFVENIQHCLRDDMITGIPSISKLYVTFLNTLPLSDILD